MGDVSWGSLLLSSSPLPDSVGMSAELSRSSTVSTLHSLVVSTRIGNGMTVVGKQTGVFRSINAGFVEIDDCRMLLEMIDGSRSTTVIVEGCKRLCT